MYCQYFQKIENLIGDFDTNALNWVTCKKNKTLVKILNVPLSFDIEVSSFYNSEKNKQCCMYAYALGFNRKVKIGRTWEEFQADINYLVNYFKLSDTKRIIIYVHNLSYEFQFIRFRFNWTEVFSNEIRKPIYARTDTGIEFRCSYMLSNTSLDNLSQNLVKYPVRKLVGELDYEKIRTSETPLKDNEIHYLVNDVLVVMSYIQELIDSKGTINNIPLTSTGFVRQYCRKNTLQGYNNLNYKRLIHDLNLNKDSFLILNSGYSGGFTHANAYQVGTIIDNVASYDLSSSYPTVMIAEQFPMSTPMEIKLKSLETFNKAIKACNCIFIATFYNIKNKFHFEDYISYSKCIEIENEYVNNGRVVSASKLKIVLTEIDYEIITQVYSYDRMDISKFYVFIKDYLPTQLVRCILHLFKQKTELKGIKGKEEDYIRYKQMLNSVYGMCVTNPFKDEALYQNNEWYEKKKELDDYIDKYNKSYSRFLYYAWGVWITAYARRNLWKAILNLGYDYIYSDTDSVKFVNHDLHKQFFIDYNNEIVNKIAKNLKIKGLDALSASPLNIKGEKKQMGIWEFEGIYSHFKTLGAKRYILRKMSGEIEICIAGVHKIKGAEYLKQEYHNDVNKIFNAFEENLKFPPDWSGKLTHTYIDGEMQGWIIDYMGKKYKYHELSGVHLEKATYEMSLSAIFKDYLLNLLNIGKGNYL